MILVLFRGQTKRVLDVHLALVVVDQVEFRPVTRMAIAVTFVCHRSLNGRRWRHATSWPAIEAVHALVRVIVADCPKIRQGWPGSGAQTARSDPRPPALARCVTLMIAWSYEGGLVLGRVRRRDVPDFTVLSSPPRITQRLEDLSAASRTWRVPP